MNEQQKPKTFEEDGTRPIDDSELEVADTFEEDGTRPIASGPDFLVQNQQDKADSRYQPSATDNNEAPNPQDEERVFEEDGTRPIASGNLEVADTFEEDGTRPIASGPDFLVQNQNGETDPDSDRQSTNEGQVLKEDGNRPIDDSDVEVVDTFEEDGTRPIMANKYDVVDTLDIDGTRPITSQ